MHADIITLYVRRHHNIICTQTSLDVSVQITLDAHERYKEDTHFEILNELLADYFERRGDDTYINSVGRRYVGAICSNSQPLF